VSTVRWNPKGMRRSAGLQSMGTIPKMNSIFRGRLWNLANKLDCTDLFCVVPRAQGQRVPVLRVD
jgi:hypothetical protein